MLVSRSDCVVGSDTSRVVVTSTLFYCLHNPRTLKLMESEIRSTFDDVEAIRLGPSLDSCHYLHACIKEAMRLSPPLGAIMPRQALAGGVQVDGHFFPEGTELGIPVYALHHQEQYHPNAFAFEPERWLVGPSSTATKNTISRAQSAFCPFGIGPRSCAGKVLAWAEMSILLARVVYLFNMRLSMSPGPEANIPAWAKGRKRKNEFHVFDSIVALHDGPVVEFRRRF